MSFTVDKDAVADFGSYLGAEAGHTLPAIEKLAREEGMSNHGFTGLLAPLGDIVKGESSLLVGTAFSEMQRKLCDLGDSVTGAAKDYGWVDAGNASMFDRNKLTGDTDEKITFGGDGQGGGSKFHYTATDIPTIERPNTKYSDDIDNIGPTLKVLDWIWREFKVADGKGFTDSIVSPLAGNYKSIEANGTAWKGVGKNFGLLASSMGANATTLAADSWEGDAAEALKQFLDVFWDKGAAWAGQEMGMFVASGFDKIAAVSKQIAALAIRGINVIIRTAVRIAQKALPIVGWAWTAIQSAGKWLGKVLGIDVDDLYDDIMLIVRTAEQVFKLFKAIEDIVKTMKDYFKTLQELIDTVKKIPETGSLSDAVGTYEKINSNRQKLGEQQTKLKNSVGAASGALSELDRIAQGAGR